MSPVTRPGSGARYDSISGAYDIIAGPAERKARGRGLDLLSAKSGERVLEIGAGTGHALAKLARAVGPTGLVCGLDVSAGMLQRARERQSPRQRQIHIQQGDGRSLPYLASTFDAVYMSFTLEIFEPEDIDLVLAEVKRVLHPTGRLAVVCLATGQQRRVLTRAYAWLHSRYPNLIDCRPIDILRYLERSSFRPTRIERLTLWSLPTTAVTARWVASTPRRGLNRSPAAAGARR